ncbi:OmpA family protein [Bacillus sp. T3]|uniref:OmpA family protein n=1 Tax=Bacillus sp. T3 TaxID=467262 RepID=UPI002981605F|nr:OmpA family protein [Bacillus sp. T3]
MAKRKHKEDHEEEHIDESWLIPYADLLTLLLALFIVLFSMRSEDVQKSNAMFDSLNNALNTINIFDSSSGGQEPGNPNPKSTDTNTEDLKKLESQEPPAGTSPVMDKDEQNLQELLSELQAHINQNGLQQEITLTDISEGIQITMKDRIVFDSGSDHIKDNFLPNLGGITRILARIDNSITIEGHTDNKPIHNSNFTSNWELSGARASSVLHYLQNNGISPNRLRFIGYGEYKPVAPNDSDKNRESNRRVNIIVLRK